MAVDGTRYFRVAGNDLVYLKFILEAYEGLATMSTVDQKRGIVKVSYGAWAAEDVAGLLGSLAGEISLVELEESSA